jgi:hypothetical protein
MKNVEWTPPSAVSTFLPFPKLMVSVTGKIGTRIKNGPMWVIPLTPIRLVVFRVVFFPMVLFLTVIDSYTILPIYPLVLGSSFRSAFYDSLSLEWRRRN